MLKFNVNNLKLHPVIYSKKNAVYRFYNYRIGETR